MSPTRGPFHREWQFCLDERTLQRKERPRAIAATFINESADEIKKSTRKPGFAAEGDVLALHESNLSALPSVIHN